jgi:hypothetical protein
MMEFNIGDKVYAMGHRGMMGVIEAVEDYIYTVRWPKSYEYFTEKDLELAELGGVYFED